MVVLSHSSVPFFFLLCAWMLTWLTRFLNLSVSWPTLCNQLCSNQLLPPILSVPLSLSLLFFFLSVSLLLLPLVFFEWVVVSFNVRLVLVLFLNDISSSRTLEKSRGREAENRSFFHNGRVHSSFLSFSPILRRSLFLERRCARVSLYASSICHSNFNACHFYPSIHSFIQGPGC